MTTGLGAALNTAAGGSQILRDFPRFIRHAETGELDPGSLVSGRITLGEINHGIDLLTRAEGIRAVVTWRERHRHGSARPGHTRPPGRGPRGPAGVSRRFG